jgi:hypothetical protein
MRIVLPYNISDCIIVTPFVLFFCILFFHNQNFAPQCKNVISANLKFSRSSARIYAILLHSGIKSMAQNSVIQGMVILDMVVHHSLRHKHFHSLPSLPFSVLTCNQINASDLCLEVSFGAWLF